MALYLLSCSHSNLLGCYYLPKPYVMADLEFTAQKVNASFEMLEKHGFIKYDEKNKVVLVKNYLKYNPIENPNQVKAAINKISELPKTALLKDLKNLVEQFGKGFTEPLAERLAERLPKPETVTVTEEVTVTEKTASVPYEEILALYQEIVVPKLERGRSPLPVSQWNSRRKSAVKARWLEHPDIDFWRDLFNDIAESNFLMGRATGFKLGFDWVFNETNFIKILEGNYINEKKEKKLDFKNFVKGV